MKQRLSEIGLALTAVALIISSAATISWWRTGGRNVDVCMTHPFWNSGAILLIPLLCLTAMVFAYSAALVQGPAGSRTKRMVRYAAYLSPLPALAWGLWLLSHFQLFPCGLF